ncbi:type II toxin-antitoxin system HicB family antitoxin [Ectothiorhodospiraceae bacterium WFHF3C12]|nr:type II toxin-antitoxin system HicB family antitoxin [Ectothiorhodospiraceae bacterium WFHF3C12]
MRYVYPVELLPDAGGYLIHCPDIPEVVAQGATRDEAIANARVALVDQFASYSARGRAFPEPSPVRKGQEAVTVEFEWQ